MPLRQFLDDNIDLFNANLVDVDHSDDYVSLTLQDDTPAGTVKVALVFDKESQGSGAVGADRTLAAPSSPSRSTMSKRTSRSRAPISISTRPTRPSNRRRSSESAFTRSAAPGMMTRRQPSVLHARQPCHLEHQFRPPAPAAGARLSARATSPTSSACRRSSASTTSSRARPSPRPAIRHHAVHGQKGYHGVAIVSKLPADRHFEPRLLRDRGLPPRLGDARFRPRPADRPQLLHPRRRRRARPRDQPQVQAQARLPQRAQDLVRRAAFPPTAS